MSTPTAYQRVGNVAVTPSDYDWQNFPLYLKYDGSDDSLQTASIDFTATDKMSVFAGVGKLSDAAAAIIAETTADSVANAGGFAVTASPVAGGANNLSWGSASGGVAEAYRTYTSPDTRVFTLELDSNSNPRISARLNGTPVSAASTSGVGTTGNYVASPLYIGRRANSTLPFNGRLYSLLVLGRTATADEITNAETYVAGKTGVTL